MTKLDAKTTATLAGWQKALSRLSTDTLDRIIKASAREFGVDKQNRHEMAEMREALTSTRASTKAEYILGFDPIFTDEGIIAFLTNGAARWGINAPNEDAPVRSARRSAAEKPARATRASRQAPAEAPARSTRASRKEAAESTRSTRATRVARTERVEATTTRAAHKGTGPVLELTIPGQVGKLAAAMGFKKAPSATGSTQLKKSSRFSMVADPNVGIVTKCRTSDLAAATRFVRRRLADTPTLLNKALITSKGGMPELDERMETRAGLKRTRLGYKIAQVA